jgi:hypothetical protein
MKWDQTPGAALSAVVPVWSVGRQVAVFDDDWNFNKEQSLENLKRMTPLVGQWKGTWQWTYE